MRAAAVLVVLLLSGCTAPSFVDGPEESESLDADAGPGQDGETSQEPDPGPAGPGPASGEPHGDVRRQEGDTTTRTEDGRHVAEKRVVLQNGYGDARRIEVALLVRYANVTVVPADVGGYTYTLDLEVRADSESQARDDMERVEVVHSDRLDGDRLLLDTHVRQNTGPLPVMLGPSVDLRYDLRIEVPRHLAYGLDLRADYASLRSGALAWTDLALDGRYAALAFADAVGLQDLRADLDYAELTLRTAPAGGDWSLDLRYGSVAVDVRGDAGYDLVAATTYSTLQANLPDLEDRPRDDGRVHKRTRDYDDRAVQVQAEMDLAYSSVVLNG